MKPLALVLAAILATLALAACGDDDDPSQPTTAPATSTVPNASVSTQPSVAAGTLLLKITDLPTGWVVETPKPDTDDDCTAPRAGRLDQAKASFSKNQVSFLQTSIVFDSRESVARALATYEPAIRCQVKSFDDGGANTDDAEYSNAELGQMSFPNLAEQTVAYQITFDVKTKGLTRPIRATAVTLVVSKGVAGSQLTFSFVGGPDVQLIEDFARKAAAKLP